MAQSFWGWNSVGCLIPNERTHRKSLIYWEPIGTTVCMGAACIQARHCLITFILNLFKSIKENCLQLLATGKPVLCLLAFENQRTRQCPCNVFASYCYSFNCYWESAEDLSQPQGVISLRDCCCTMWHLEWKIQNVGYKYHQKKCEQVIFLSVGFWIWN